MGILWVGQETVSCMENNLLGISAFRFSRDLEVEKWAQQNGNIYIPVRGVR
jgi:hypothetical protein